MNKIEISQNIYGRKTGDILELIKKQNDNVSSLMIFGHNPVFTDLYNLLSGERLENLSTSAVACIQFETENCGKIDSKTGKTIFLEAGK